MLRDELLSQNPTSVEAALCFLEDGFDGAEDPLIPTHCGVVSCALRGVSYTPK